MTIPASTLRKLSALSLSTEQMAGVLDILADSAEAEEARKEAQRERTRRAREKQRGNVTVTRRTRDGNSDDTRGGVTRVEDKPLPTEIEPQEENKKRASAKVSDLDAFKAELSPDLDEERLAALIEHRRRKRAALTAKAARMFRADADRCGLTIAAATDTCIRRNWITVEPDWLAPNGRAGPAPPKRGVGGVFADLAEHLENGRQSESTPAPGATILSLPYRQSG